jgi:heme oxygenase
MAGKYHKNYNIGVKTEKYCEYIFDLKTPDEVLAHLYVWHMGDLYGGQAIKELMTNNTPSRSLEFNNREFLIDRIRTRLKDDLAPEAIVAFDWAIRLMNQFVIDGGEDV